MATTLNLAGQRIVQSSELSRNSAAVFAAAEEAPVEVSRRDGESLILTTKREAAAHERVLEIAAQLIAVSLDDKGTLEDRLARPFPWIKLLSVQDQRTCARDIIDTARGAFVVNQPGRILTEIKAWQNTAEAVAAGWGQDELEWLREPVTVTKPRL
ncbi:MAG: prevent-host-death protein [Kineosporiaceae bacterium]|nr:prevent-host-death protein [Aeromicrobium sp.]